MGRRKLMRPFDPKRPMHIILKSSQARGDRSMLLPIYRQAIATVRDRAARRHQVKVLAFSNVGNHLHLTVLARHRRFFQGFLREFSGHVAVAMTGAARGRPARADLGVRPARTLEQEIPPSARRQFWDALAWTRIIGWGRDLKNLTRYFRKNDEQSVLRRREAERKQVMAFLSACYATAPPD